MSSREEFLEELVASALQGKPGSELIDELLERKPSRLNKMERATTAALKRVLACGDFRRELSAIILWASYETMSITLDVLADPGVDSVDGLQESLLGIVEGQVDFEVFEE